MLRTGAPTGAPPRSARRRRRPAPPAGRRRRPARRGHPPFEGQPGPETAETTGGMASARLLFALLAMLLLATSAHAAPSAPAPARRASAPSSSAPTSRQARVLPRTPSFAWEPVRGRTRYEFQLATSSTFRENGHRLRRPPAEEPASPRDAGAPVDHGQSPYSLYARVRAIVPDGATTPWSTPFGFNMRWPDAAAAASRPLPGLLRWTPVDGATGYEVWLERPAEERDQRLRRTSIDQREYYSFHQA